MTANDYICLADMKTIKYYSQNIEEPLAYCADTRITNILGCIFNYIIQ